MSTEPVAASAEEKQVAGEGTATYEGSEDEKLQNARKQSVYFSVVFLQISDSRLYSRVLFCRLEPAVR
jgi:hypothetical protein